jgi:UDP-N-acetylmuramate dehydrogenase
MADTVRRVELLAANAAPRWEPAEYLALAYRHSRLRESRPIREVILRAEFELQEDDPAAIQARMLEQKRQRQATQPLSSASAGSVFKNPPGDSAARLVDQAGLKGMCVGGATVSTRHANFMVTSEGACASDVFSLIELVRDRVRRRFGVELDLEVHPIGRKAPAFA